MAWAFEFKAGLGWAAIVTLLMVIALWASVQMQNIIPLLLPILVYAGFVAWVEKSVKK